MRRERPEGGAVEKVEVEAPRPDLSGDRGCGDSRRQEARDEPELPDRAFPEAIALARLDDIQLDQLVEGVLIDAGTPCGLPPREVRHDAESMHGPTTLVTARELRRAAHLRVAVAVTMWSLTRPAACMNA